MMVLQLLQCITRKRPWNIFKWMVLKEKNNKINILVKWKCNKHKKSLLEVKKFFLIISDIIKPVLTLLRRYTHLFLSISILCSLPYLWIAVSPWQNWYIIGGSKMAFSLLYLAITFSFSPLGPSILKPNLIF